MDTSESKDYTSENKIYEIVNYLGLKYRSKKILKYQNAVINVLLWEHIKQRDLVLVLKTTFISKW